MKAEIAILIFLLIVAGIGYGGYRLLRFAWAYHSRWKVVTIAERGKLEVRVKRAGDYNHDAVLIASLNPNDGDFAEQFDAMMEKARVTAASMNVNAGANKKDKLLPW